MLLKEDKDRGDYMAQGGIAIALFFMVVLLLAQLIESPAEPPPEYNKQDAVTYSNPL